jgi:hypothetical protein
MPVYTFNTPQGQNQISATTNLIQQNFEAIRDWTNVDHVQISGAGGNEGKHAKVSLIQQTYVAGGNFTPSINPANGRGTLGIYAALNAANDPNSQSRMWAVIPIKDSNTTWVAANIPFTESQLLNSLGINGQDGYTYLPSGILIQYSSFTQGIPDNGSISPSANIVFPIPFPNKVFSVMLTPFIGTTFSAVAHATLPAAGIAGPILQVGCRSVRTSGTSAGQSGIFRYVAIGF